MFARIERRLNSRKGIITLRASVFNRSAFSVRLPFESSQNARDHSVQSLRTCLSSVNSSRIPDYRVVVRFFLANNYWCLGYARIELYQHEILRAKVNRQLFNQELHFDLQSSHSIIYDCNIVNGQVQSLYLQANQHNKNETL